MADSMPKYGNLEAETQLCLQQATRQLWYVVYPSMSPPPPKPEY